MNVNAPACLTGCADSNQFDEDILTTKNAKSSKKGVLIISWPIYLLIVFVCAFDRSASRFQHPLGHAAALWWVSRGRVGDGELGFRRYYRVPVAAVRPCEDLDPTGPNMKR